MELGSYKSALSNAKPKASGRDASSLACLGLPLKVPGFSNCNWVILMLVVLFANNNIMLLNLLSKFEAENRHWDKYAQLELKERKKRVYSESDLGKKEDKLGKERNWQNMETGEHYTGKSLST